MLTARDVEEITGFMPRNMQVYILAFTHKSAARKGRQSYDRLEFLEDSYLGFVVARHLFILYPRADEGFLSRMRHQIVSRKSLATVARRLGLAHLVIMNERALSRGWNHNDRILEDVFEALIAAVLEDQGPEAATDFIIRCVQEHLDLEEISQRRNYKDELCRFTQDINSPPPRYHTQVEGCAHVVRVDVITDNWKVTGREAAGAKKEAQQRAALHALELIGNGTCMDAAQAVWCN